MTVEASGAVSTHGLWLHRARTAASLEKRKDYAGAEAWWEEAAFYAISEEERHWCEARAAFCCAYEKKLHRESEAW